MSRFDWVIIACCCSAAFAADRAVVIDGSADGRRPVVKAVAPCADEANAGQWLKLVRVDERGEEGPAVFGEYRVTEEAVEFTPAFALSAGGKFRAILSLPGKGRETAEYVVPAAAPTTAPSVVKVYPSGEELPANLLKFYVYFSTPMRQTDRVFEQMHVLDEAGKPVYDPWRRLQQWSDDGKRLTLWIHPGRVKRGVNLREELGPVLEPGKKYRLVVDADVTDLGGSAMGKAFEKAFTATEEDHARVSPEEWKVTAPMAGTREALVVTFPKPLDEALLRRLIRVKDGSGKIVPGEIDTAEHETAWRFMPKSAWGRGEYVIEPDALLEDLAGNTPVRVFDTDMTEGVAATRATGIRFDAKGAVR